VVLTEHFAKRSIAAIHTSSMSAAVQTARAIRNGFVTPVTFCTSLTEADFGTWTGTELAQNLRHPYYPQFMAGAGFPGGESFKRLSTRMLSYIEQLAKTHARKCIVVVSHEWALRALLCKLCNVPFDRVREIEQDPGRVSIVRTFRGAVELKAVNNDLAGIDDMDEPCDLSLITQLQ